MLEKYLQKKFSYVFFLTEIIIFSITDTLLTTLILSCFSSSCTSVACSIHFIPYRFYDNVCKFMAHQNNIIVNIRPDFFSKVHYRKERFWNMQISHQTRRIRSVFPPLIPTVQRAKPIFENSISIRLMVIEVELTNAY